MDDKTGRDQDYIVCEFFGIKLTTKNAELARILTTDIGEFLSRDIYVRKPVPPREASHLKINIRRRRDPTA